MGPAFCFCVKNTVAVDDLAIFVFEQRNVEVAGKLFFELFYEVFGIVVAIDADREDLDLIPFFLSEKAFQLAELLCAVGSPLAAIEHQNGFLIAVNAGKRDPSPIHVLKRKVRGRIADFDPFEIGGRQIRAISGAELSARSGYY